MGKVNLNMPILQDDELIDSFVERFAYMNGLDERTICDLIGAPSLTTKTILESIKEYPEFFNIKKSPLELFINNTVYIFLRFFTNEDELNKHKEAVSSKESGFMQDTFWYHPKNFVCPICAKEDIKKYGYPIQRVYQNFDHINVCVKHKCSLIELFGCRFASNDSIKIILNATPEYPEDKDSYNFAKFMYKLSKFKCDYASGDNTHKVVKPFVNLLNYEEYLKEKGDNSDFYNIASRRYQFWGLLPKSCANVLFKMYGDNFDLFIERYNALKDENKLTKTEDEGIE